MRRSALIIVLAMPCCLSLALLALPTAFGGCRTRPRSSRHAQQTATPLRSPAPELPTVYVQPLESTAAQPLGARPVRDEVVEHVVAAIRDMFNVKLELLPVRSLPDAAYYKPRNRYRADRLLDALEDMLPKARQRILGITEVDISTTKGEYQDWGIFGLGRRPGHVCVVSTWRLRSKTSQATFHSRIRSVAVHELGHTLGLRHCPTIRCIMEDAKGRVSTVDRATGLCSECRRKLKGVLR